MASADSVSEGLFASGPPFRVQRLVGLGGIERDVVRRAVLTAAVCWLPVALLVALGSALSWGQGLVTFAKDIGFHTCGLVAAPLLIISEVICGPRLASIARHFLHSGLVSDDERPRFDTAVSSTLRLRDAPLAEFALLLLALAAAFAIVSTTTELPLWRQPGTGPLPRLSAAAWWEAVVSLPILLSLIFGWFWRIFLWTRFLWLLSRLELRLVLTHPDSTGGLGFVGNSVRVLSPLAFSFGVITAGGAADAIVNRGHSIYEFRNYVLALLAFVVIICCAPPCVFCFKLLASWRRGISEYGAAASALGREVERAIIERRPDDFDADVPDLSKTVNLYEIADRAYQMKLLPLDLKGLAFLVVATVAPFVPVVFVALPFEVILARLTALLH